MAASRGALVRPDTPSIVRLITEKFVRVNSKAPMKVTDWIRASSLSSICAREEVLASKFGIERVDSTDSDLNLTFAQGTGMHWVMQNQIFPALGKILVGKWRCTTCHDLVGGMDTPIGNIPMPDSCAKCKPRSVSPTPVSPSDSEAPRFEYVEQFFANKEYRLTGHNDGFLRIPGYKELGDGIFELKSISAFRAKGIKDVPDMGHAVQAQAYMWLTGCKWALLLYWDKGTFRGPLTEHFVERDEDTIDQIKNTLKSIWDGIESGALPERICTSEDCKRAGECMLAKPCFAEEEVAT